ncbi:MAG: hypothetical protein GQ470_04035 [Gammaproteobacteria bacterium]|nr:hypothetical protein [Gammaproteobacteria bacterium]
MKYAWIISSQGLGGYCECSSKDYQRLMMAVGRNNQQALRRMFAIYLRATFMVQCPLVIAPYVLVDRRQRGLIMQSEQDEVGLKNRVNL